MQESSWDDPRDGWGHARRIELVRYANALGHAEIIEAMPKTLIVKRLKALGVPPPPVPLRTLDNPRSGDTFPTSHAASAQPQQPRTEIRVVDVEEDAENQWKAQQATPVASMSINELRNECKRLGIKMARTDRMDDLRAKINDRKNAA